MKSKIVCEASPSYTYRRGGRTQGVGAVGGAMAFLGRSSQHRPLGAWELRRRAERVQEWAEACRPGLGFRE